MLHYFFRERELIKTNELDLSFFFIFFSRWIKLNKFELIDLHKNTKITLIILQSPI